MTEVQKNKLQAFRNLMGSLLDPKKRWKTVFFLLFCFIAYLLYTTADTTIKSIVQDVYNSVVKGGQSTNYKSPSKPYEQVLAGSIRTEEGEPMADVNVSLLGFDKSVQSDNLGRFKIRVKVNFFMIYFIKLEC